MIPLFILSIMTIYIFVQKWVMLKKTRKESDMFMEQLAEPLENGDMQQVAMLCKENAIPVARMIEKGVERVRRPVADVKIAMENVANMEVTKLEHSLPYLATIAGGAPMIGFLGTVMGMIQAFFNMAQAGANVDISLLSGGIYTAMVTTVAGLIVGIMAYFGYNYLTAKVSDLVAGMESASMEFLESVKE